MRFLYMLVGHLAASGGVYLMARLFYRRISVRTGTPRLGALLGTYASRGFFRGGLIPVVLVGVFGNGRTPNHEVQEFYAGCVGFGLLGGWVMGWIAWGTKTDVPADWGGGAKF